jgi:anti-sigma factor RsiW
MNCREWEEAIALYTGGDLDSPRALEVERHLAGCTGCQVFANGLRECREEMRAFHREEIPAAHYATVRARVLAQLQPAPWWHGWLRVATAAAACLAVCLAIFHWNVSRPVAPLQVAVMRPPEPELTARPAARRPPRRAAVHVSRRKPARAAELLTVRIITDNPDVVIYWITNPRGE